MSAAKGLAALGAKKEADKENRRVEFRKHFPESAKIADEFRAVFGDGVQLLGATEAGRTIGVKPAQNEKLGIHLSEVTIKGEAPVSARIGGVRK